MEAFTAHVLGPRGALLLLDIQAADMRHARQLAREQGLAAFGRRGFSFTVRAVA